MMRKKIRMIINIFFIIFLISIIFSYTLITVYSSHNCIGSECNICYEINLMKSIFDNLLILSLFFIFIKCLINRISEIDYVKKVYIRLTPVKLKVKLSE